MEETQLIGLCLCSAGNAFASLTPVTLFNDLTGKLMPCSKIFFQLSQKTNLFESWIEDNGKFSCSNVKPTKRGRDLDRDHNNYGCWPSVS